MIGVIHLHKQAYTTTHMNSHAMVFKFYLALNFMKGSEPLVQ